MKARDNISKKLKCNMCGRSIKCRLCCEYTESNVYDWTKSMDEVVVTTISKCTLYGRTCKTICKVMKEEIKI